MNRAGRRVFGLGVWSDIPLQPLEELPAATDVDVSVWLSSRPRRLAALDSEVATGPVWYVSPYADDAGRPMVTAAFAGEGRYVRLRYREGTEFVLDRQGTEIAARWPDSLTLEDVTSYVLGPVMGLLLRLRGVTCLHASAVAMAGRAIVFVGVEGSGKSTIAAALAVQGFPVLSDDVVPLEEIGGSFLAHPGWARLRLWPPSVRALSRLGLNSSPAGERRFNLDLFRYGYRFHADPLPVGAIYLLGRDNRPRSDVGAESVAAREKLMSLVADTFAARLLDRAERAREFDVLARLVASVPVRRLLNGASLDRVADLCRFVRSDVAQLLGTDRLEDPASTLAVAASRQAVIGSLAQRASFD